jgi:hypothetical protein
MSVRQGFIIFVKDRDKGRSHFAADTIEVIHNLSNCLALVFVKDSPYLVAWNRSLLKLGYTIFDGAASEGWHFGDFTPGYALMLGYLGYADQALAKSNTR